MLWIKWQLQKRFKAELLMVLTAIVLSLRNTISSFLIDVDSLMLYHIAANDRFTKRSTMI